MHSHLQLLGLWRVLGAGSGTEAKIKPVIGKICQSPMAVPNMRRDSTPMDLSMIRPRKSVAVQTLTASMLFCFAQLLMLDQAVAVSIVNPDGMQLKRVSNSLSIRVDGMESEAEWQDATELADFRLMDSDGDATSTPTPKTTAKAMYNDRGVYLLVHMEQDESTFVMEHSLHDEGSLDRDHVTIELFPSRGLAGGPEHFFTLFFGGSKRDGTYDSSQNPQTTWNGRWYGRTVHNADGWSAEFFIPWQTLETDGEQFLGVVISRRIARMSEPNRLVSSNQLLVRDMQPRHPLSLTPFVATNIDIERDSNNNQYGAEVFWRPTLDFRMSAHVLPDFGTVEADDVITNLTVFETFYVDKREEFTEAQQFFALSSTQPSGIVPFHSRRIGDRPLIPSLPGTVLDPSRLYRETDLLAVVKGTGQHRDWKYGALGAWEDDTSVYLRNVTGGQSVAISVPGREFGVLRLRYEDTGSHRMSLGTLTTIRRDSWGGDAFTYMFDGRYTNADESMVVDSNIYISDVEHGTTGFGGLATIQLRPKPGQTHHINILSIDDHLNLNSLGYNRRNDQTTISYLFSHSDNDPYLFRSISTGLAVSGIWNSKGERTNNSISLSRNFLFYDFNRAMISVSFRPSFLDDTVAYRVEKFRTSNAYSVELEWATDESEEFSYSLNTSYRKSIVEGGNLWFGAEWSYRPNDSLRTNFRLSKAFRDGWLRYRGSGRYTRFQSWGPRAGASIEYAISSRQSLAGEFQWESIHGKGLEFYEVPDGTEKLVSIGTASSELRDSFAISQVVFHVRYAWEVTPLADVSLVYTKYALGTYRSDNSMFATLRDQLRNPTREDFAFKLRYFFGN